MKQRDNIPPKYSRLIDAASLRDREYFQRTPTAKSIRDHIYRENFTHSQVTLILLKSVRWLREYEVVNLIVGAWSALTKSKKREGQNND